MNVAAVARAEAEAEGRECAEAEVVGRAASDAQQDERCTPIGRVSDELPGAERRGVPGVPLFGSQQGQARRGSHFDEGDLVRRR